MRRYINLSEILNTGRIRTEKSPEFFSDFLPTPYRYKPWWRMQKFNTVPYVMAKKMCENPIIFIWLSAVYTYTSLKIELYIPWVLRKNFLSISRPLPTELQRILEKYVQKSVFSHRRYMYNLKKFWILYVEALVFGSISCIYCRNTLRI